MARDSFMVLPASALRSPEEKAREKQAQTERDRRSMDLMTGVPEDIARVTALWPRCAVCNRPVERMAWTSEPGQHNQAFTVYCHGAEETTVVSPEIARGGAMAITGGTAFATKGLRDG